MSRQPRNQGGSCRSNEGFDLGAFEDATPKAAARVGQEPARLDLNADPLPFGLGARLRYSTVTVRKNNSLASYIRNLPT